MERLIRNSAGSEIVLSSRAADPHGSVCLIVQFECWLCVVSMLLFVGEGMPSSQLHDRLSHCDFTSIFIHIQWSETARPDIILQCECCLGIISHGGQVTMPIEVKSLLYLHVELYPNGTQIALCCRDGTVWVLVWCKFIECAPKLLIVGAQHNSGHHAPKVYSNFIYAPGSAIFGALSMVQIAPTEYPNCTAPTT